MIFGCGQCALDVGNEGAAVTLVRGCASTAEMAKNSQFATRLACKFIKEQFGETVEVRKLALSRVHPRLAARHPLLC